MNTPHIHLTLKTLLKYSGIAMDILIEYVLNYQYESFGKNETTFIRSKAKSRE